MLVSLILTYYSRAYFSLHCTLPKKVQSFCHHMVQYLSLVKNFSYTLDSYIGHKFLTYYLFIVLCPTESAQKILDRIHK